MDGPASVPVSLPGIKTVSVMPVTKSKVTFTLMMMLELLSGNLSSAEVGDKHGRFLGTGPVAILHKFRL